MCVAESKYVLSKRRIKNNHLTKRRHLTDLPISHTFSPRILKARSLKTLSANNSSSRRWNLVACQVSTLLVEGAVVVITVGKLETSQHTFSKIHRFGNLR